MQGFIISSWDFSTEQVKQNLDVGSHIESGNWYHCQRDAAGLRNWLEKSDIPEGVIDSLLADDTRPRFEQYSDDSFLIILRCINLNAGSEPDDMLSLRILWHNGALISSRKIPSRAVSSLIAQLEQGKGPASLERLLLAMVTGIHNIISDFLVPIEEQIGELEKGEQHRLSEFNDIYYRLLKLRRYLKPQRYVFEDLIAADVGVLADNNTGFKNCLDIITRVNESIDFYIDQINFYLANVNQKQAEIMNRNTYLFSVIAGIFLPAGFFTGLLGVNIGGIPGVEEPMAFTLFCVALLVVVIFEVIILRRLRFI